MPTEHSSKPDVTLPAVTRRGALRVLGGAAGAVFLVSCGGSGDSTSSTISTDTTGTTTTTTATTSSSSCAVTPEGEIGPYFADDSAAGFNRIDIRANIDGTSTQSGIPLTLNITVVDTEKSCIGLQNAQVDIWHCNAEGVYSDEGVESTTGETWLRGFQLTDSAGNVQFTTIFPGWYQGRTTHIHLRVRSKYSSASSTSDGTNTTQVFFPQATVNTTDTTVAPYSSHGTNSTTNASDRVYATQTEGKMELALTGDATSGYAASVTIGLPITSV
jgi:protocatechuate 3,4-dioxygenase beta subunit